MPEIGQEEEKQGAEIKVFALLKKYPRLSLGVLAQLANVGAQATLWGYFVDFKLDMAPDQHLGFVNQLYKVTETMTNGQIAGFHASFALVLFMLGRFVGTALMNKFQASKILGLFTTAALILLATAFVSGGLSAVICIMCVYFFHSIVFPTIFALATNDLETNEQKLASSLVIMAIVGGAILPPIAGVISTISENAGMQKALIIPFICFAFITYYAVRYPYLSVKKGD